MNSSEPDSAAFSEAIETAAVQWLLEREEGFKPGRAQAFAEWCAADVRHAAAVTQAAHLMDLLVDAPTMTSSWPKPAAELRPVSAGGLVSLRGYWAAGLAAVLACAAVFWWMRQPGATPEELYLVTEAAIPQQVALSDGSVVAVNANSKLQVHLLSRERRVELKRGEAHFEVAHDPDRPFVVNAGGISVLAVGTAFNVRIGEAGVEVLVTEGRVKVSRPVTATGTTSPVAPTPLVGAAERVWVPRDQGAAELVVSKVDENFIQHALGWQGAITNFSNRSLREIVTWFNRQNTVQLVLADAELGERRIGGAFAIDQPAAFAELMEQGGEIVVEKRGEREIVLHRAR